MHLSTVVSLSTILALCQAQSVSLSATTAAATGVSVGDETNHWCGDWAGSPTASDVPTGQQLPVSEFTKRFFVEPQLQRVPFSPIAATEPKVQIPKIWGNGNFRLALLSYATTQPAIRIYASSKSRWSEFHDALQNLMTECVAKGSGGAYLVPPSPGLTQATLVLYAYEVGSQFDFQMNYYMTTPTGINPARLGDANSLDANVSTSGSVDYTASSLTANPPAGYTYLGCYNETVPQRALSTADDTSNSMTVQACATFCGKDQYFGVEFGTQCYCGNTIGSGSVQVNDGCVMACAGDETEACGGVEFLNVYQKQTQTA